MSLSPEEIRDAYESSELCGWAGVDNEDLVREQFELLSRNSDRWFDGLSIEGQSRQYAGKKMMLYEVVRKVLGKDTDNYAQQIGDCVSFGMKNAAEYLQCCQILMARDSIRWRPIFPPYYYGTGRTYVGGGQLGNSDGSLGSWMAEAVMKYGTLFSDEQGVPAYSGSVAKKWGDPRPGDDLDKWKPTAEKYLIKSAALVKTWDELVAAIVNGYPCTTASDIGYDMEPSSDGFHRQRGSWAHQMSIIGVDDNDRDPYAIILNSWGDAHGRLKDFDGSDSLPIGVIRARRKDIEKHLRANETFAVSAMVGFPEQDIDKALFDLIGEQ